MNVDEARDFIQTKIDRYETMSAAARAWDLRVQYLNDVMKGRRPPSKRLLAEVGLIKKVVYLPRSKNE